MSEQDTAEPVAQDAQAPASVADRMVALQKENLQLRQEKETLGQENAALKLTIRVLKAVL